MRSRRRWLRSDADARRDAPDTLRDGADTLRNGPDGVAMALAARAVAVDAGSTHLIACATGWTQGAITSLVGSALRHVQGPGGLVVVRVTCETYPDLAIAVRDNGPGISADRVGTLLRRDRWRPGSALARLLVEDIAVAHGGRLVIETKTDALDHFTSVRFTIPLG